MSEIIWEIIKLLAEKYSYALKFSCKFLKKVAELYAIKIREYEAPLTRCIGLFDCFKMNRPDGHNSM